MLRFLNIPAVVGTLLLAAAPAPGQDPVVEPLPALRADPDPDDDPVNGAAPDRVPNALRSTIEALGASAGVPDGAGLSWYPRSAVRGQTGPNGQAARMALTNFQFGATAPVYTDDADLVFANGSARVLAVRSDARLPTDRVHFPRSFWDVQAGGGYVHQFGGGWSAGGAINLGTASDRPFNSLAEATLSALAFVRMPDGPKNGVLFYVVSTSNGQLGRNIPVPGVAYEYHSDRLTAVVGFPFVNVDYRPTKELQFEFTYAALTDVLARASYHVTDHARVFTGFQWTNQSWFRAGRRDTQAQTFLYQKQFEGGFGWQAAQRVDFRFTGGYAFDRYFIENRGLSFTRGRNRVDLAPGPFVAAQLEFKY